MASLLAGALLFGLPHMLADAATGDAVIRGSFKDSEIVITTTSRLAGAIHSVRWRGKEFIDSADHGRQLQSACSFDNSEEAVPETFNPTEAGSRRDGAGPKSSSRLLELSTAEIRFERSRRWPSGSHPANVRQVSSRDFWFLDSETRKLQPLSDGPGEQEHPVAFSTRDGAFAMGIIARKQQPVGAAGPGYGRFRFPAERVTKWNCVFRLQAARQLPARAYEFKMLVPIGTLTDVEAALAKLAASSD